MRSENRERERERERDLTAAASTTDWHRAHEAAHRQARIHGMCWDDAQDFACDFALFCLTHPGCPANRTAAAAHWYATKRALNRVRIDQRQRLRIHGSPEAFADVSARSEQPAGTAGDLDEYVCRIELYSAILEAVDRLNLDQRRLFQEAFVHSRSSAEIAEVTGRTPQAIRQALTSIRRRIRDRLTRRGMGS